VSETIGTIIRGIILGFSITAPIGPTNIEVIKRGAQEGWKSARAFCLGVIIALVIYLLLVVLGLSFLTESELFNTALTLLGVLVLAYLSYNSLRDFFSGRDIEFEEGGSGRGHFVPGIVLTISNPAILLLWTGIMGADLAASGASPNQGLMLSIGILIGVVVFFTVLIFLIHHGRKFLRQRYIKYVSLAAGIVLMLFCIQFAYDLMVRFL
jgi:threonine/homoserine/homoserine lactone efflux protein